MTTKADYTPEEWRVLFNAPVMAGMVVMLAGQSGPIQVAKEMFAIGGSMAQIEQEGSSNQLITSIVAEVKARNKPEGEAPRPEDVEQARTMATDQLREVSAILDRKSTPEEAAGFKQWLVQISQKVAEAAKEGGFLGFGGTQVTTDEQAAMQQVAAALGVSGGGTMSQAV
jgi:hypothetical protein